ncbi:hypothetical protein [Candidatus Pantoea persica]|nr:hypothetical protein [Candidatus Pantoea persica]MBA2817046.1 hypothetical protein [Candidatus Pantoea persica]
MTSSFIATLAAFVLLALIILLLLNNHPAAPLAGHTAVYAAAAAG